MLSLLSAPTPRPAELLAAALAEIGTKELAGSASNPRIDEYLSTVGLSGDETPWCAAFVNWCLRECGLPGTGAPNARSFLGWGEEVRLADIKPGDIVVYSRGSASWQGHVNIFVERAANGDLICVGGNQSNAVTKAAFKTDRVLGVRRVKRASDSKTLGAAGAAGTLIAAKATVDAVTDTVGTVHTTVNTITTAVEQARDTAGTFTTIIEREPAPAPAPSLIPGVDNATLSLVLLVLIFAALAVIVFERLKKLRKGR